MDGARPLSTGALRVGAPPARGGGGGGGIFTGVTAGTYQIAGSEITVDSKGRVINIVAAALPCFTAYLATTIVPPFSTGTPTAIPLDVVTSPSDDAFTHTPGSPFVTINEAGRYKIEGDGTGNMATTNVRSTAMWMLFGTTAVLAGSARFTYHRNTATGWDSCTTRADFSFPAGTILSLRGTRIAGIGPIAATPGSCMLQIQRVD